MNAIVEYITQVWLTLAELAPWFLLGAVVAGLLHGFAPSGFVRRRFSGSQGVVWSVLFGIPLPLCSCAVIPTGVGLRRNGASEGASIAFLIATPQTGVDSVFVTAAFLGWTFAFYKLAVALVLGLAAGWLIEWLGPKEVIPQSDAKEQQSDSGCCDHEAGSHEMSSCCSAERDAAPSESHRPALPMKSSQAVVALGKQPAGKAAGDSDGVTVSFGQRFGEAAAEDSDLVHAEASCCGTAADTEVPAAGSCCGSNLADSAPDAQTGVGFYLRQSFSSSLSIIRSIYLWVLAGVLISAALNTWVKVEWVTSWIGQSYGLQLLAALLIGIPLYVCATASVPVAAALVGRGLSTGASVVFLLAGPATNVATIGAVRSQFSRFAFWTYLAAAIGGSILFAVLYDQLFSGFSAEAGHLHEHANWWNHLSAIVLVTLFLYLAWPRLTGWLNQPHKNR